MSPYDDFVARLRLLIGKNPHLVTTTLSNILSMRLIGNKTHRDFAGIGIAEFINQFMYDFKAAHVGKGLYRAKGQEEDIQVVNEVTKAKFPVSLKAYSDGPLQLSPDKSARMFPLLSKLGPEIQGKALESIWKDPVFSTVGGLNILPLIYDEEKQRCNILVFDAVSAKKHVTRVVFEDATHGRKHPVFRFYDAAGGYVCEVRCTATANALPGGLWTHTKDGLKYFHSVTNGWINYSHNHLLVRLFSQALAATRAGHEAALEKLAQDIEAQRNGHVKA
ncbi:MAG: hypothetical protein FWD57_06345 [Polyangiaceae bacterium]|nr:hypothetical protein [Polyangiaceae bacterium]